MPKVSSDLQTIQYENLHYKTMVMAFRGKKPIRTKTISDRILEQVSHFNYLENDIGYDRKYGTDVTLG